MDEKHIVPTASSPFRNVVATNLLRPPRRLLHVSLAACIVILLNHFLTLWPSPSLTSLSPSPDSPIGTAPNDDLQPPSNKTSRVPLEAHIMSKCPDARDCLRKLVVPAMEQIYDKVDFRLSYIGSIDPATDDIVCKHGPTECLGNMLLLCAANLYPNSTVTSLGFSTCLVSSYRSIPEQSLVENCALEYGVDFDELNACVSEEGKGLDLLRNSVERSREAGIKYSCTVRLEGGVRCIRDGGRWKDCEGGSGVDDLVRDVEEAYTKRAVRD